MSCFGRRSLDTYDSYPFASRRATRKTCLEVVTFLTAPARVEVVGYGTFDAPAGQFFRQFPLQAGEIRIKVRRGGRSVIDWTSPVDGVVDLAATVEGGRGHGACYASFERGSEKFCETRLTSNVVSRLAMPAVPVRRGETIWLVDDHREAWGLGGLVVREWKVRLK